MMVKTNNYGHYCPGARALDVIGEKWALLVVRDLLYGPRRFSDLLESLGGITPKLLTRRLRDLEAAEVLARDEAKGRREVWYRLLPAGEALRPVFGELLVWGVEHAALPEPGEVVGSTRAAGSAIAYFNRRGITPASPTVWQLRFNDRATPALRFDGDRWSLAPETDQSAIDLKIDASPDRWIAMLRARGEERNELLREIRLSGTSEHIGEFIGLFTATDTNVRDGEASLVPPSAARA